MEGASIGAGLGVCRESAARALLLRCCLCCSAALLLLCCCGAAAAAPLSREMELKLRWLS